MKAIPDPIPARCVEIAVLVHFGDTDPYGVVYFASYFRYFHQGLEEFFRQVGLAPHEVLRNEEQGFGLPVAGASCNFFKPVRYGQTLRLAVYIAQAKKRSLTFGFSFYDEGGELVASGEAAIVAIDRQWSARVIPQHLRDALEPYLPPVHTS